MRAYRKGTRHPYCLYLDEQEAAELEAELAALVPECFPLLGRIGQRLKALREAEGE